MKNAYSAPTLTANGSAIRATLGGVIESTEGGAFRNASAGSIGYYL